MQIYLTNSQTMRHDGQIMRHYSQSMRHYGQTMRHYGQFKPALYREIAPQ